MMGSPSQMAGSPPQALESPPQVPGSPPCHVPVVPPAGLSCIYNALRRIYPNQPNPLQVTALRKFW